MRKGLLVVLGVAFVLALATSAVAAEKAATTTKAPAPKTMRAWGTVKAVNAEAKTLTVTEKSGDVTFKLADNFKVMENGKALAAADLKANQHVSVHYTVNGADKVASEVFVSVHHAMAKPEAKKN